MQGWLRPVSIGNCARRLRCGREDRDNDPDCALSAHLLNDQQTQLFALKNGFQEMTDLADTREKADPCKGCNFVAGHHVAPLLAALRQALQSRAQAGTT